MEGARSAAGGVVDESIDLTPIDSLPVPLVVDDLPKIYSAPRRFDLASTFVVTTAYAILLTILRSMNASPAAMLYIAAFITIVGVAQPLLFGGERPRTASLVGGFVAAVVLLMAMFAWFSLQPSNRATREQTEILLALGLANVVLFGAPFGYLAGALVGGVFLIADVLRQKFGRSAEDSPPAANSTS